MAHPIKQHGPMMSLEEYLFAEQGQKDKHEFHAGYVYSMAGGSHRHAIMQLNIGSELRAMARGKNCVASGPDIQIWVEEVQTALYADVALVCGKAAYFKKNRNMLVNPRLIVEVLSPGTRDYDLSGKFEIYKKLASFHEYLVVESDSVLVIHHQKDSAGVWTRKSYKNRTAEILIPSLGLPLAVSALYENL